NAALLERYGGILQIRIIATVRSLQVIAALVLEDLRLQGFHDRRRVDDEVNGVRARRCKGERRRKQRGQHFQFHEACHKSFLHDYGHLSSNGAPSLTLSRRTWLEELSPATQDVGRAGPKLERCNEA